jgi:hypothetical protein
MTNLNFIKEALSAAALLAGSVAAFATAPSGTLPVLYINTADGTEITSKDYYLTATYWLDANDVDGVESFGSEDSPLTTEIKARGNYSWWGFDKKPYKLKLADKTALLGMKKHKHFALMARADDTFGYLRDQVGFELSRRMGLAWTPDDQPVELYLNGDYKGLYFLTETIKVDKNRVNITEQDDNATDETAITGGWLVEIDNYDTDPHVTVTGGDGQDIWFTYKSPEVLSTAQESFLYNEMSNVNTAIYAADKTSTDLENLVDLDVLARYYMVQEIMDDGESFHGSCYLYRDRGENQKWMFGPVWDFGNSFARSDKDFIYNGSQFHQTWIGEIAKFPAFQTKCKDVLTEFVNNNYEGLNEYIDNFIDQISAAAAADVERWPAYGNSDLDAKKKDVKNRVATNINWLCVKFGVDHTPIPADFDIYLRGDFNNWSTSDPFTLNSDGTYSIENVTISSGAFKIGSLDWLRVNYGSNGEPLVVGEEYQLKAVGENIFCATSLDNVTFTFDRDKETLLVTQTNNGGTTPPLPTIYLRGQFNDWQTTTPFTRIGDGLYQIDDVSFSGAFKVASADWSTVNFGSNGQNITLGETYYMVRDVDDNIHTDEAFDNVRVTFDYNLGSLLVSSSSNVDTVQAEPSTPISVNGRTVTAAGPISVYTTLGALVMRADNLVTLPAPGLYIIVTPSGATTLAVN